MHSKWVREEIKLNVKAVSVVIRCRAEFKIQTDFKETPREVAMSQ